LFQLLVEELADHDLVEIARERLTRRHTAIDVDVEVLLLSLIREPPATLGRTVPPVIR
jgi:hypothetical protein